MAAGRESYRVERWLFYLESSRPLKIATVGEMHATLVDVKHFNHPAKAASSIIVARLLAKKSAQFVENTLFDFLYLG